jgi:pyruvate,water dikinase
MDADALVDPPETLRGDLRLTQARAVAPQAVLKGVGGSAGLFSGVARVVVDPEHAPIDLSRRDILVVPFTDIGWTPLLANVGGIVSETGGQLSHAAIVAREYGLPAVVGVRRATRAIRDGQPITLDGGLGLVYLDGAPSPSVSPREAN